MMLTRPPGPRSTLNLRLLMAISEGCEEIRYRRVPGGYEEGWLVKGVWYGGGTPLSSYVRPFVGVLGRLARGRPGLVGWAWRCVRRLGSVTERGSFDLPVGPVFVVEVTYRAAWHRGRVAELDIVLGESAAIVATGIAKQECDHAAYGPFRD